MMRWLDKVATAETLIFTAVVSFAIGSVYASLVGAALRGNL